MEKNQKPALLLFPNLIGDHKHHEPFLPSSVDKAVKSIDGLIAESDQAGRRFLGRFFEIKASQAIPIALFNEHTPDNDIDFLLEPIKEGQRWGYVSDAGLPCIADPGAKLVSRARKVGIIIQAFVGPSSILMALMLSGFSGQQFTFHGYLSKDLEKRKLQMRQLEKTAIKEDYTQIFMEAPYRNQQTLTLLLETLSDKTLLCAAWDLTLQTQGILSQPISLWKKSPPPNLDKRNTIFLISN